MMDEFKTPDQIEQEVLEEIGDAAWTGAEVVIETIALFRKKLAQNGYVFYQP